jgi:hypothetical protein
MWLYPRAEGRRGTPFQSAASGRTFEPLAFSAASRPNSISRRIAAALEPLHWRRAAREPNGECFWEPINTLTLAVREVSRRRDTLVREAFLCRARLRLES